MPNWTMNTITVRGAKVQLECFRDAMRGANGVFDFSRIKPMPAELDIECGSRTDLGMACFSRKAFDHHHAYPWFKDKYPGVDSPTKLRAVVEEKEPQTVELGRKAAANIRKYGVPTWYEWCIREWGTKWNACHAEVGGSSDLLEYTFDTAWDAPRPLVAPIVELAHSFDLTIVWSVDHEDGGPEDIYDDDWAGSSGAAAA